MGKVTKTAPKEAGNDKKLAKVDKKSVTIQKAAKNPVKNLKEKATSKSAPANALTKPVQKTSPQKKKNNNKNLQKKTKPSGGAAIVAKKAKTLPKAANAPKPAKDGKPLVTREVVSQAVTGFKEAIKLGLAEKKAMLDPDFRYILQIVSFKIPQVPQRMARTQLKHAIVDETDEICLFVKDVEVGNKRDYQPTIDFFKEKLEAAGVTNIKTIMPIAQIAKDYKQSEMLRKLCNSYDCFLVDSRIALPMAKKLGKTFVTYKKSPISVQMTHSKLKEHLEKATAKVAYVQPNSGDSTAIHIGKHAMDHEKVVDNVVQVLENMKTEYPGGLSNIKRVYLRPAINLPKSSFPVYVNASTGEDVPVPVAQGPRAKAIKEKQKELNQLLPSGMIMTNKGDLAFVAPKKRAATGTEEEEKTAAVIPAKKQKKEKKEKKNKQEEAIAVVEKVEEPAETAAPKKKEKKQKAAAVVAAAEEEKPVEVAEKKAKQPKKEKKAAVAPVEVAAPVVPEKKQKKTKAAPVTEEPTPVVAAEKPKKKGKAAAAEPVAVAAEEPKKKGTKKEAKKNAKPVETSDDANLSKEVSELWEQIKGESDGSQKKKGGKKGKQTVAELDAEWEQVKNESVAELGDLEKDDEPVKKKNKKAAPKEQAKPQPQKEKKAESAGEKKKKAKK